MYSYSSAILRNRGAECTTEWSVRNSSQVTSGEWFFRLVIGQLLNFLALDSASIGFLCFHLDGDSFTQCLWEQVFIWERLNFFFLLWTRPDISDTVKYCLHMVCDSFFDTMRFLVTRCYDHSDNTPGGIPWSLYLVPLCKFVRELYNQASVV